MIFISNVFFLILCLLFGSTTNFCSDEKTRENRITNSVCWGASGDACGAPVEFMRDINKILETPGYSSDFLSDNYKSVIEATQNFYGHKFDYVPYTDDTRMSLLVFQVLQRIDKNRNGYPSEEARQADIILQVAEAFKKDFNNHEFGWAAKYRAPGGSTETAINNLRHDSETVDDLVLLQLTFKDPNNDTIGGGCGSVMHAAPFGYFKDFWQYSAEHSKITHNHPIAIASCVSLARGINYMIDQKWYTKSGVIKTMIETADEFERKSVNKDDFENNYYEFRMRRILETALDAANKMSTIRREIARNQHMSAYLISFHDLMKNDVFREAHIKMFPYKQWEVPGYSYDQPYFSGWDAATCLAIALYNFSLWIPDHIDDLDKQKRMRCLTNAITSAMVIGGDSDSAASLTGQVCGAFVSQLTIPVDLEHIAENSQNDTQSQETKEELSEEMIKPEVLRYIFENFEDYDKIMKLIKGEEVDLFDHADKHQVNTKSSLLRKVLTKKGLCYTGISLAITSILSWLFYNKVYLNYYSKK